MNKFIENIRSLDAAVMKIATKYQDSLLKPAGSFGRLEDIAVQISGITGKVKNKLEKKIHFVFGADNGVYEEGVASTPQHYTNLLMNYYAKGIKCGINVLCDYSGVDLKLIDLGVKGELKHQNIINYKLMKDGTNNFLKEPAMEKSIVEKAINIGIQLACYAKENDYDIIGTGEVGMANTTTSAACIMAALGINNPDEAVGRGAGLTDEAFENKKRVIVEALSKHKPMQNDVIDILSKVGGLDIAGLVGLYIGAAFYRIPIVIDGIISITAAMLAYKFNPLIKQFMIPSHISEEPGYKKVVDFMEVEPILNLRMRLGEGTGCPIAMQIIDNALEIINVMSTFEDVELDESYREGIMA